jgi:quinol-cytochrome oxidoreductase complex cytochrome b subunit
VNRLVRAEFLKLRTTQVWFWMLLAAVGVSALITIGPLAAHDGVKSAADVPAIFANSNGALITVFVLGILGVTTEFRYQTITPTVLATPSRWSLVSAKLLTYAIVGVAYSAVCLAVQLAIALPWLSSKHITVTLADPDVRRAIFGLPLVFALFAIVGIGVGALLRNQIVAVSVSLIFLLVIENLIAVIPGVRRAYAYTPSGAVTSILFPAHTEGTGNLNLLGPIGGVVVLVLWAFVPAIVGARFSMNRDIT